MCMSNKKEHLICQSRPCIQQHSCAASSEPLYTCADCHTDDSAMSKALSQLQPVLQAAATRQHGRAQAKTADGNSSAAVSVQTEAAASAASKQDPFPTETSAETRGSTAWQTATENHRLHATVLSHMCQYSRSATVAAQQEAAAGEYSLSGQGTFLEVRLVFCLSAHAYSCAALTWRILHS